MIVKLSYSIIIIHPTVENIISQSLIKLYSLTQNVVFHFLFLPRYEEEKKKLPRKGASREKQTLALLERFSAKVQKAFNEAESDEETPAVDEGDDNDDTW